MTQLKFYLSPISISFSGIGHSDSSLCINNFIYTRNNDELFENLSHMISQFDMKFLGDLHYFLGIEVQEKEEHIFMSESKYIWGILKFFRMLSSKRATTPLEVRLKLYGNDDSKSVYFTLSLIGCKFDILNYNSTKYIFYSEYGIMIYGRTQGIALGRNQ